MRRKTAVHRRKQLSDVYRTAEDESLTRSIILTRRIILIRIIVITCEHVINMYDGQVFKIVVDPVRVVLCPFSGGIVILHRPMPYHCVRHAVKNTRFLTRPPLGLNCVNDDGCTIKDQITTRITVDPGVQRSRVFDQSIYSPNNFDFTQIHFEWWALCHQSAEVCGTDNAPSFPGTSHGTFLAISSVFLYGDRLAHAFELWGFFEPTGKWVGNPGRTGTATCAEKPDRTCVY
jgi:hypothetical protein